MASRLSAAILLFLLSSSITLCYAHASSNAYFARKQAERLINSFNLSPKHSVNIVRDKGIGLTELVERSFRFPGLASLDPSIRNFGHHAGAFPIKHSYDASLFYYFFESRGNISDPVVLWLTGGPGCGSELALFYENGPFQINDDLSLKWNDFGWDKASNLLYVDQPTGTGFSYSSDNRDIRSNETQISNDLYDFLQTFFQAHPEFAKNDFYITGESYAGHYIPVLASRVQQGNKAADGIHINLKGFAIGNGLTDPAYQYPAYGDFALANKLISQSDYKELNESNLGCVQAIDKCQTDDASCDDAYFTCTRIFEQILDIAPFINYYDIRKDCEGQLCYDFSNLDKLMSLESVKKALGIGNIEFVSCSETVHQALVGDWMKDYEPVIPPLLEDGIKVLIYAGEYDLICNWLGNYRWVNAMKWSGQERFSPAKLTPFIVGGKEAGLAKSVGPLTFLKVHDAGHLVPMDQPNVALQMLENWMKAPTGKTLA